jgi:hypothetical protein
MRSSTTLTAALQKNSTPDEDSKKALNDLMVFFLAEYPFMFPYRGTDCEKVRKMPTQQLYQKTIWEMFSFEPLPMGARMSAKTFIQTYYTHGAAVADFAFWWSAHLDMFGNIRDAKCTLENVLDFDLVYSLYRSAKLSRGASFPQRSGVVRGSAAPPHAAAKPAKKKAKAVSSFHHPSWTEDNANGQLCSNHAQWAFLGKGHTTATCVTYYATRPKHHH